MRVTRLLSMVFEIDAHPGITAGELADRLGVSVRTVYRDISGLQMAGVPVYGTAGRNGGLRLVEGYRSHASALRAGEAAALLTAVVPGMAAQLGLGADADRGARKVRSSTGRHTPAGAMGVGQVLVDPVNWYRTPDEAPHLPTVAAALRSRNIISIRYERWAEPTRVRRRIAPLGLVFKAGTWYLVARSRNRIRTYRVNQILSINVTEDTFDVPDGFDLGTAWTAFMASFSERLHVVDVRVRVERTVRDQLRSEGDASVVAALNAITDEPEDDHPREITLPFESLERAAAELMRLGPGIEALGPPELRELIRQRAAEVATRHSSSRPEM